ncbi:unnamed protein product [Haemonchus placei]|uniref:GCS light chain n=1 Tax=Haemonchus placei TaxID=6290 RepID=A0A0N4WVQ1_HAEPC|nr:unnamed protein product [Haemonchus placei]
MPPITSGNSFTVHTGNLNNYIELVTRRHKNSAAEIATAFKHLAAQNTVFRITEGVFSPTTEILQHPKNDVKTSLKVCLSTFSANDVENAVQVTLDTLKMGTLSQLIVSFPYDESTDLSDSEWLEKVRPIWAVVESLVDRDLVHSVGVSDLDVDRLRLICEDAKEHKPTIDHYSIDGCCAIIREFVFDRDIAYVFKRFHYLLETTVPAELVEYAKANDIQLLTHNDPRNCDLDADVFDSIGKITDTGRNLTYKWAARYTIWIRSRSVMAAKGYFVQFIKN